MKSFKEMATATNESKEGQKAVKAFWDGAAVLMRALDGKELKQFKSALGDIDDIIGMTDLREGKDNKND